MARQLPAGITPGLILCDPCFYRNETGGCETKHLMLLAQTPGADIVYRLLTGRPHGRPETPPCYHGLPYSAFYLGVLGGKLGAKSWLDLRWIDDFDEKDFARQLSAGRLIREFNLPPKQFLAALECTAGADDLTQVQERAIRDQLALLRG